MGISAAAAYTSSDRTNDQMTQTTAQGDKAEAWTTGLKYDANNMYQFDFGLRPAVSFLMSKGKDLTNTDGDKDLVKYADIGATYYFNRNMSTYVDYKINLLDEDDSFYSNNGISTDDVVALGLVYQF